MNPKVDKFLSTAQKWQKEMETLRKILLDCQLEEALKWGLPCYMYQGKNVVVIQGFKDYCALLFLKGFLLSNSDGILVRTGANTKVGRQARFTHVRDIVKAKTALKTCIYEAIEVEKAGVKAVAKKEPPLKVPEELQRKLDKKPALKTAFQSLTPGRQKAYIHYFSAPKLSQTRESRIEKYIPQILKGIGLNDRFLSAKK